MTFPWVGEAPTGSSTGSLLRAPDDATAETAAPPSTAATAPPAVPAPAAQSGPDLDEIYEQVVERLRRDLLVERERMGDLLGDLP